MFLDIDYDITVRDEKRGRKVVWFGDGKKKTVGIIFPEYHLWQARSNAKKIGTSEITRAVIYGNRSRQMISSDCFSFVKYFSDEDFLKNYVEHLMGLLEVWRIVSVNLLSKMRIKDVRRGAKIERQFNFARKEVSAIGDAVYHYRSFPLGILNFDFIMENVEIKNSENARFLYSLMNHEKIEILTRPDENTGYLELVTRVFNQKVIDGEKKLVFTNYVFGAGYNDEE